MKIALTTTQPDLIENRRIEEEALSMGYEYRLFDLGKIPVVLDENTSSLLDELKSFDIVIVRGVFFAQKVLSALINDLRNYGVKVFDNNFLEHRYSIDKLTDLTKISLIGIPIPKTYHTRNFNDFAKNARELGYPVVVKSTRMGKGIGVFKIDSEKDLEEFIYRATSNDRQPKNYIMQEFIPYKHDLRALIIGGEVFCMKRIPSEGEFRANFSLGGEVETFELDENGKVLAAKALLVVGMSVGGVDVLITKDDFRCILEVNHTPGFVGMEKATGKNIAKIYLQHAIKEAK